MHSARTWKLVFCVWKPGGQIVTDLLGEIERLVGPRALVRGEAVSERATSYWDPSPTSAVAIVKPGNTDELASVMKLCHANKQPVVTQGGLTGCVSGAVAGGGELIVSLENMNAIESLDAVTRTATVQAGVVLERLHETAAEEGLIFPLDLGARGSCTVGGNIATNAGGINVLRYGMTRQLVLGLEVVTAQGEVLSSMNQMLKNNAGYDLKQLFIGSEGTLGIVTRAVLRLFPAPRSCNTALLACDDFASVIGLLNRLESELAGTLSAFEVMWQSYYVAVTGEGGHRAPIARDYAFYVVAEAEGADSAMDDPRFESCLERAMEAGQFVDAVLCKSEAERRQVWDIREGFEAILPGYLYDVSLPISRMADYVSSLTEAVVSRWPAGCCHVMGHIADGNLHLFIKPGEEGELHAKCDELVYRPLADIGGSVSAEHGIGTEKMNWLAFSRTPEEIEMMRLLKRSLDPVGILNPQRVIQ
jgi:FAD/FMN-containing dehydrogenase